MILITSIGELLSLFIFLAVHCWVNSIILLTVYNLFLLTVTFLVALFLLPVGVLFCSYRSLCTSGIGTQKADYKESVPHMNKAVK